jgi:hypothetical protein
VFGDGLATVWRWFLPVASTLRASFTDGGVEPTQRLLTAHTLPSGPIGRTRVSPSGGRLDQVTFGTVEVNGPDRAAHIPRYSPTTVIALRRTAVRRVSGHVGDPARRSLFGSRYPSPEHDERDDRRSRSEST